MAARQPLDRTRRSLAPGRCPRPRSPSSSSRPRVSFDGLSHTFCWLDPAGANPLEHPGPSALVLPNTLGVLAAPSLLLAAFAACATARAPALDDTLGRRLGRFLVSIAPIAFGSVIAAKCFRSTGVRAPGKSAVGSRWARPVAIA